MEGSTKFWQTVDLNGKDSRWRAASRHTSILKFPENEQKQAFVLIQEANMGGSYVRCICFDSSGKSYFTVSSYPFSVELTDMKLGDEIVNTENKLYYKVIPMVFENPFIKILELVDQTL